jgi:excisionase family DNA binding protein
MGTEEHYRPEDAARYLGVSRSTLFAYIRQGRLHAVRLSPRRIYLRRADLAALLEPEDVVGSTAGLWADDGGHEDGVAFVERLRQSSAEKARPRRSGR